MILKGYNQRLLAVFFWIVISFSFSGCSATNMLESWKTADLKDPIDGVLVIARIEDEFLRRATEDRFAKVFRDHGLKATPSYQAFPNTERLEKERVENEVKEMDLEGFFILRILDREEKEKPVTFFSSTYNPLAEPYASPRSYYGNWYSYYDYGYGYPYSGTPTTDYTVLHFETNLYRPDEVGLVWSAWSETAAANGIELKIDEVARMIVNKMAKENVIVGSEP